MSGAVPARPPAGADRVAVVIVNYESGPALTVAVDGFLSERPAELVVVDNGSTDGAVGRLRASRPEVRVVTPGRNLGYGAAANRGAAATESELVLVCNPDLIVAPGAVASLVAALDADPGVALAGPLVKTPEGERYPSARQFPSLVDAAGHGLLGLFAPRNRFTRAYQQTELSVDGRRTVGADWVSGACFLARKEAFEQVGGFDESYFMYAEDVDLCWRLHRAGWEVAYVPGAEVTHLQGVSTDRRPYRMIVEHHRSLWRFAVRSTTGWQRALLPVVAVGIVGRAMLACLRRLTGS